jgi:hypothetical protein
MALTCRVCKRRAFYRNPFVQCEGCSAFFFAPPAPTQDQRSPRPWEVPLPPGMSLEEDAEHLTIRRRWYRPLPVWGVGFFAAPFLFQMLAGLVLREKGLFVTGAFVGLLLSYPILVFSLNRTTLRLTTTGVMGAPYRGGGGAAGAILTSTHGPIPIPLPEILVGDLSLRGDDIEQLYCVQDAVPYDFKFRVKAKMRSGQELTLVAELRTPEQALFLEQQLERRLGLSDQPVIDAPAES